MSKLRKGHNGHFGNFKSQQDKIINSSCLLQLKEDQKREFGERRCSGQTWRNSSEREPSFSIEIRAIRPSAVFGTRRRAALRGEGFAWVPDLGSFLKLREVGVSPYLGFILRLSVFTMFALNEAVRGRLIGSKAWNRGVGF